MRVRVPHAVPSHQRSGGQLARIWHILTTSWPTLLHTYHHLCAVDADVPGENATRKPDYSTQSVRFYVEMPAHRRLPCTHGTLTNVITLMCAMVPAPTHQILQQLRAALLGLCGQQALLQVSASA